MRLCVPLIPQCHATGIAPPCAGCFTGPDVLGFMGVADFGAGTINIWGDGDTSFELTTWEDTAEYTVAAVLSPHEMPRTLFVAGVAQCEPPSGAG